MQNTTRKELALQEKPPRRRWPAARRGGGLREPSVVDVAGRLSLGRLCLGRRGDTRPGRHGDREYIANRRRPTWHIAALAIQRAGQAMAARLPR